MRKAKQVMAGRRDSAFSRYTAEHPAYSKYTIGIGTYGHPSVLEWGQDGRLAIGNYCSIAKEVVILLGGEHRSDWVSSYPFQTLWQGDRDERRADDCNSKGDVVIGNDVWIGRKAMLLSGVSIGNGAVIGAGAVVAKDVPAYAIAVGNPARVVRYRFSPDQISALLSIAWWDWPPEKIRASLSTLMSSDIDRFIDEHQG
jgi:acetyltransferase-like isoleucine patch superfamily enzyme